MSKKWKNKFLVLLLMVTVLSTSIPVLSVQAGASSKIIGESSYATELNGAVWNDYDGDVQIKDKKIIFTENSTEGTKLITKAVAEFSEYCNSVVDASVKIRFTELPQGEVFAMALGLSSTRAELGEKGNIEIRFQNDDALTVSIVEINEAGEENTLLSNTACGKMGTQLSLVVSIKTEGILELKVGGKEFASVKLQSNGEGRFGFIQSGGCAAEVSDLKVTSYHYSRPENCDIEEDFEKEIFNSNYFHSELTAMTDGKYVPSYIAVEEYEDSNVLMFRNVGYGFLSTKLQYSNFEMTFDVPYIQRKDEINEEGKVVTPASDCFTILVGAETWEKSDSGTSTEMIVFYPDVIWLNFQDIRWDTSDFLFRAEEETRAFSVKVSMIDSILSVAMKWEDETTWVELGSTYIEMADGYIQIMDPSTGALNFAIDNLKIVNKDADPNVIEVPFESAVLDIPEDWNYEPIGLVYDKNAAKEEQSFNWYILIPIAVGVGALSIIGALGIKKVKQKKGKEGEENEK